MRNIFNKDQIFTIPNLLSLVRLALIPVIIWLYCEKQQYGLAVIIVILSGLTDVLDGFIARRFNMTSEFGKILDPVADKLTQTAMLFCLAKRYKRMKYLIALFASKEVVMCLLGMIAIKKTDRVVGAKWFGKATTMLLYLVLGLLIFIPHIEASHVDSLINICGGAMVISVALYIKSYLDVLRENN